MLEGRASPSERAETDPTPASLADALPGVERLRERRGAERVSFDEVADHLVDFVERDPHTREEIDNLATFLAGVEQVDHAEGEEGNAGAGRPG